MKKGVSSLIALQTIFPGIFDFLIECFRSVILTYIAIKYNKNYKPQAVSASVRQSGGLEPPFKRRGGRKQRCDSYQGSLWKRKLNSWTRNTFGEIPLNYIWHTLVNDCRHFLLPPSCRVHWTRAYLHHTSTDLARFQIHLLPQRPC